MTSLFGDSEPEPAPVPEAERMKRDPSLLDPLSTPPVIYHADRVGYMYPTPQQ